MTDLSRSQEILRSLQKEFLLPERHTLWDDPFPTLIQTVLSQATNDKNRDRAFANLAQKYAIDPRTLAKARLLEIEKAIRVGGLFRNKSRVIKTLSRLILDRFDGTLDFVYSRSIEDARNLLMSLPGVGPKTADVVLLFSADKSVLPIDTHVNRVSKRLGLVKASANYENTRLTLKIL